jgi:hypothetical protein
MDHRVKPGGDERWFRVEASGARLLRKMFHSTLLRIVIAITVAIDDRRDTATCCNLEYECDELKIRRELIMDNSTFDTMRSYTVHSTAIDTLRDLTPGEVESVGGGISGISFVNINFDVRYLALLARHPW